MPADLKFDGGSVAVWLRHPKVASRLGDLVEVWQVEERPDLCPVGSLSLFIQLRKMKFGNRDDLPLFIHEDGSNLSKGEFNKDLKIMLDMFPELASSDRDSWTGHSFRSGLSTLLQSLGFSEEEIQVLQAIIVNKLI